MAELIQRNLDDNGVLDLKLNINAQNQMNPDGFAALEDALTKASEDKGVRVLMLGSAADGFYSNGLDPAAVHGRSAAEIEKLIEFFFSVLKKVLFFPVPVVACISGHAMGYGAMLALFSDYRFMIDKGARIAFPEINIGISLPVFVVRVLQDVVGPAAARDLLYLGKALKGPDALELGLVDELHEADKIEDKARALAKKLAGLSASGVRSMKTNIIQRYAGDVDAIIASDLKDTLALMQSADAKEGFAAMTEKRRPKFS